MLSVVRDLGLVRADPVFRKFWLGMLISRTGDAFTVVALSWLVLTIAGPAQLGILLLCQGLPRLVAAPVAGRLLDRWRPGTLLGWDNAIRAVLIGLVPVLWLAGGVTVPVLCVLAAAAAAVATVSEVAESAVVPRLVADVDLDAANSLLAVNWELAAVLGPPASGVLVSLTTAPVALLVDAVSFAVMSALCFTLPSVPAVGGEPGVRGSFGSLFGLRPVLLLTVTTVVFLFLSAAVEIVYPVLSRESLNAGAAGFGVLVGVAGAGGLLGVVLATPLARRVRPGRRVAAVLLAGVPPLVALAWAGNLVLAAVLVGLAAFAWAPYFAVERSLVQRLTPEPIRGRVMGARTALCALGFPAGSAAGGLALAVVAPSTVLLVAAGVCGLSSLVLLLVRVRLGEELRAADQNQ